MRNYTTGDFKNATLAIRGSGDVARRSDPDDALEWRVWVEEAFDCGWHNDASMAKDGWTPMQEQSDLSMDALEAAYEAAEEVPEYSRAANPGDTLIRLCGDRASVWVTRDGYCTEGVRILRPAPRPLTEAEKIQEILNDLSGAGFMVDPVLLSRHLAEHGVRVVSSDGE
ncbi:hypothetical protein [Brevibacterium album]|uniref:hypothetical protein n=1 Tax=Brevibacterium album TaxID=417948 RepID=UPI00048AB5DF|nr:hypothetical protein [Brevibacterium album]